MLATDVDFGPDGALYFTDWVEGWDKPSKGRIYRVLDPARRTDPAVQEVKRLLAEGMEKRPNDELADAAGSCRHEGPPGGPVRAGRRATRGSRSQRNSGRSSQAVLGRVAAKGGNTLARIHAIWGLGQIARASSRRAALGPLPVLEPLLADHDPEVRAQAAKVLGERASSRRSTS